MSYGGGGYRGHGPDWNSGHSPEESRRFGGPGVGPPPFRGGGGHGPGGPLFPKGESRVREAPPLDEGPPRKQAALVPFSEGKPGPPPREKESPNDCEIVVVGNCSEPYVNHVEMEIKSLGLRVDVMFPKANMKISSFIEGLAQRGTIFAVVIRPDNEAHKSVSVHVLRGSPKPEEHRNMPLNTAFGLLEKLYGGFKKKEIRLIPDNIKSNLRSLLEDRLLTDSEYATTIAYLQERRRRQASFESRTPFDSGRVIYTPEELQKKILAIFNDAEPISAAF